MPIDGTPDPQSDLVPVIWRGRTINMDPGDVGSYSLDKAQKEVQSLRNSTHTPGNRGDAEALEFHIDKVESFIRAADEVVRVSDQEIARLQDKRRRLHGNGAAARFDRAIRELETNKDRHVRMRGRLRETLRRLRRALHDCRRPKRPLGSETNGPV